MYIPVSPSQNVLPSADSVPQVETIPLYQPAQKPRSRHGMAPWQPAYRTVSSCPRMLVRTLLLVQSENSTQYEYPFTLHWVLLFLHAWTTGASLPTTRWDIWLWGGESPCGVPRLWVPSSSHPAWAAATLSHRRYQRPSRHRPTHHAQTASLTHFPHGPRPRLTELVTPRPREQFIARPAR